MLLALLLPACGCPDFADVRFVDETGDLSSDDLSSLADTVAWFEQATGLAGVCVDEVVVEEDLVVRGDEVAGHIDSWTHRIRLEDRGDMERVLVHELCHGASFQLGRPELDRPELFDPDSVDPELYHSQAAKLGEAFANACEWGPRDLQLGVALAERCGETLDTSVDDFLLGEIYTLVQYPQVDIRFTDLSTEWDWRLDETLGDHWVLGLAATDTTIAVLVAQWEVEPHRDASPHDLAVVHLDPWTRQVVSETQVPARPWLPPVALLDGQDAVWLLVADSDAASRLERVPVGGGRESSTLPPFTDLQDAGGLVRDGRAWLLGPTLPDLGWRPAVTIDLGTGEIGPDPLSAWDHDDDALPLRAAGPDGPLLALSSARSGSSLLDVDTGAVTVSPRSGPIALRRDGRTYTWSADGIGLVSPDGSELDLEYSCEAPPAADHTTLQVGETAWLARRMGGHASDITLRNLPL